MLSNRRLHGAAGHWCALLAFLLLLLAASVLLAGLVHAAAGAAQDVIFVDGFDTGAVDGDRVPPVLAFESPDEGAWVTTRSPAIVLRYSDGESGVRSDSLALTLDGEAAAADCTHAAGRASCVPAVPLSEREYVLGATIRDLAGNLSAPVSRRVRVDATAPVAFTAARIAAGAIHGGTTRVEAGPGPTEPGLRAELLNESTGIAVETVLGGDGSFAVDVAVEPGDTLAIVALDPAGNRSAPQPITVGLPPDAAAIAPPIDPADPPGFGPSIGFLYGGPNPIQVGADPSRFEPQRIAVVRGRVLDATGEPLPGARVSVRGHSEFGRTLSRADGYWDLAVNGGGTLTIDFAKGGRFPAQRQVNVPWNDFATAPDVVLLRPDPHVIPVDLAAGEPVLAVGPTMGDAVGQRRAAIFFPAGTQAELIRADGTTAPLPRLSLRFTEYTLGERGEIAMPGTLPPTSGYTYAVEVSADEQLRQGVRVEGVDLLLDRLVPMYLDNFLHVPVGARIPAGFFNADQASWVGVPDGWVLKVVGESDGRAALTGTADDAALSAATLAALGIDDDERRAMATLFEPGESFWRTRLDHLSSWDSNMGSAPPDGAQPPDAEASVEDGEACENSESGCEIGQLTRTMGETVPLPGFPGGALRYSSRTANLTRPPVLHVRLSGDELPGDVVRILLEVRYLGQHILLPYDPLPNRTVAIPLQVLDPYHRQRYGEWPIQVRVGYQYEAEYTVAAAGGDGGSSGGGGPAGSLDFASFGYRGFGLLSTDPFRGRYITLWWEWEGVAGIHSAKATRGMGGWSLPFQHVLEVDSGTLRLGSGSTLRARDAAPSLATRAGGPFAGREGAGQPVLLNTPTGLAVAPDGTLYVADRLNHRVLALAPGGSARVVAGTGAPGFGGDDGSATAALLDRPADIALGADGRLYIADSGNHRVRVVGADGRIATYAGSGNPGFAGDFGPAVSAQLNSPVAVAVSADGQLYIADGGNRRIRHVGPDRMIATAAGGGAAASGPALSVALDSPVDLALDGNDRLLIADAGLRRLLALTPGGQVAVAAGSGAAGYDGDGVAATEAAMTPVGVAWDGAQGILIADSAGRRLRRVDAAGIVTTWAGSGDDDYAPEGAIARRAALTGLRALTVGPSGEVVVAHAHAVRRFGRATLLRDDDEIRYPSPDGQVLFAFDAAGRHRRTLDALTGGVLYELAYTGGLVTGWRDAAGNAATIERNAAGAATGLLTPDGQRIGLALDANGFLSQVDLPDGTAFGFVTSAEGRLHEMTDRRDGAWTWDYDADGGLVSDRRPDGSGWNIVASATPRVTQTTFTTMLGRSKRIRRELLPDGSDVRTETGFDGTESRTAIAADGSVTTLSADGSSASIRFGVDPRFGALVRQPERVSVRTPAGLESVATRTVSADHTGGVLSRWQEQVTRNGRTSSLAFTRDDLTFRATSAMGRVASLRVDAQRRPLEASTPGMAPVAYAYDARGRLTAISQSAGGETRSYAFAYDANGYLAGITDPLGRSVAMTNDAIGRARTLSLPGSRTVSIEYDDGDNVTALVTPRGDRHAFGFDALDRDVRYTAPPLGAEATETTTTFDLDGLVDRQDFPGGVGVDFGYDAAGRLTDVSRPVQDGDGGEVQVGYEYDGFLVTKQRYSGEVAGAVTYGYDTDFRLRTLGVEDGTGTSVASTTYDYDADGALVSATTGGQQMTLARDSASGRLTGTTLGVVNDSWEYNGFGEPRRYVARVGSSVVYSYELDRDLLGRIARKVEFIDGVTSTYEYTYDAAGRLDTVRTDGALTADYDFDANGNRTRATGVALPSPIGPGFPTINGTLEGTYDAQDRILTYGSCHYLHTPNGELAEKRCNPHGSPPPTGPGVHNTRYTYDVHGNLTAVRLPDGRLIEYAVDGQGRRTQKKVDGEPVKAWLFEDQYRPIAELDGQGAHANVFTYADRQQSPAMVHRANETQRMIVDHLGSPRVAIDWNSQVVARWVHDEWGALAAASPAGVSTSLAGGVYDGETGLTRFGARDYDPSVGRWVTRDPMQFGANDTNLYAYTFGDPVNHIDPTGRIAWGLVFGLADLGLQLYLNGGRWDCVNWADVGLSIIGGGLLNGLLRGVGKIKTGSKAFNSRFRSWYRKEVNNYAGDHQLHHWLIPNNGSGRYIPNAIKNQPWNLNPLSTPFHQNIVHGFGPWGLPLGAPSWAGELAAGTTMWASGGDE